MRLSALLVVLLACGVGGAAPALGANRPDVVIELPGKPFPGQVAPQYVDAFTQPGRLLYRFDATLKNRGGALDLYKRSDGPVMQAIWDGGKPPPGAQPRADSAPQRSAAVKLANRGKLGASMSYVVEPDHSHFHFMRIARYELRVPGRRTRVSPKIGFCFYDDSGPSPYFPEPDWDLEQRIWCAMLDPEADLVRMGLSRGASDRYGSQKHWQWVDMTGLRPGRYTLRGIANPRGYVAESNGRNNVIRRRRSIPGVLMRGGSLRVAPGSSAARRLTGRIVAPGVPARRSADCEPSPYDMGCYVKASAEGPLSFALARSPAHGSVNIAPGGGRSARVTYTPEPGFSGRDSFAVTATDARGLASRPAKVKVRVTRAAGVRAAAARREPNGIALGVAQHEDLFRQATWSANRAPVSQAAPRAMALCPLAPQPG